MFMEFIKLITNRPDIQNNDINTLLYMIVIPSFWIMRCMAVFGMFYPIFTLNKKIVRICSILVWIGVNIFIYLSKVDVFWKWLWVDYIGIIICCVAIFKWQKNALRRYYYKIYKK